ncbi:MAG: glutathione S-transferase family protein [Alphaproteobacteria bacterium]|nr:glutathione S-transferase family protein [Alphaproteobacteria bacterium]
MKLYGAPMPAPNPRRVRIFLAEKGIALEETPVDLMSRAHKSPEHLARNALGQVPTLELDDGTTISETVSICRYFEALHPTPPLFGSSPVEQALTDMWIRRTEFVLMQPVGMYWRHAHPRTARLLKQYTDFGHSNVERYGEAQAWFDRQLADRPFLAGETYSMADICALSTVDFATWIGLPLDPKHTHLAAWHARVTARPSAAA